MAGLRRRSSEDPGFTLVEVLLAIAILGVGVLAVTGGMMTSIKVSDRGQRSAQSQGALRGYAEALSGATYVDCATASSYSTAAIGFTAPTGYTPTLAVSYWTAAGATGSFGATCGTDSGIQRVVLMVTEADGTVDTLRAIKRRTS